jgi:hypothetical protein
MNSGFDIHRQVASQIFNIPIEEVDDYTHRRFAKTIVFGLIYGMSAFKLSLAINVSVEQAEAYMKQFFDQYPGLVAWLDEQVALAKIPPYKSRTAWGTCRSTRNILSTDFKERLHTERQAKNTPIQGTAGELTLFIICNIMDRVRALGWDVWLVNSTHDSATFEVPESLAWYTPTGKFNDDGEEIRTYEGPMVELCKEEINRKIEVEPLQLVNFTGEVEVRDYWSAKPDLHKALGFKEDEGLMRWSLIKSDELLSSSELEELEELEQVNV